MWYYIRNILAIIRGMFYRFFHLLNRHINIGSHFVLFKECLITSRNNGNITIGKNVRIEKNVIVSAVNGGQLILEDGVGIGQGNIIKCQKSIQIGEGTLFGPNVMIYDQNHKFDAISGVKRKEFVSQAISIGKNCWIGAGVVILKGTIIGNNCVIGAGSILSGGNYPDGVVVIQKKQNVIIQQT